MRVDESKVMIGGAVLAAALSLSAMAHADGPIAGTGFAGLAGNGNSGVDAFGQPWAWSKTSGGLSVWGLPGLGAGVVDDYNNPTPATEFFVAFLTSHTGTYIDTTPSPSPSGFNDFTRFSVCAPTCVAWTPEFNGTNPLEVDFIAPPGSTLVQGDDYFVNVLFTKGVISGANAGFSGVYSASAPEAATWAMMLLGAGGIGGAMRIVRRKQDANVTTA